MGYGCRAWSCDGADEADEDSWLGGFSMVAVTPQTVLLYLSSAKVLGEKLQRLLFLACPNDTNARPQTFLFMAICAGGGFVEQRVC